MSEQHHALHFPSNLHGHKMFLYLQTLQEPGQSPRVMLSHQPVHHVQPGQQLVNLAMVMYSM
jgi:hypothetical protein